MKKDNLINLILVLAVLIVPAIFHAQRVLVAPVTFDDTRPYTNDEIAGTMDTVSRFYSENSLGLHNITYQIGDWHTFPISPDTCNRPLFQTYAREIDFTGYDSLVIIHTRNACGYSGFGMFGERIAVSHTNNWLFVAHEYGHAPLGLAHSVMDGNVYTDPFDIMGGFPYHLNLYQKTRLGWGTVQEITQTGTYRLSPYQSTNTGFKVGNYYIEKREPFGFDSGWIEQYFPSIQIRRGDGSTYLYDSTPETIWTQDAGLPTGRTWTDGAISITALSQNEIYVEVPPIAQVCKRYNPKGRCIKY